MHRFHVRSCSTDFIQMFSFFGRFLFILARKILDGRNANFSWSDRRNSKRGVNQSKLIEITINIIEE